MTAMTNEEISTRFFEALDSLKETGKLHGINQFTIKYGIDRRNMYKLKKQPDRDILKAWWLTAIVEEYKISAKWLLTGQGSMYGKA